MKVSVVLSPGPGGDGGQQIPYRCSVSVTASRPDRRRRCRPRSGRAPSASRTSRQASTRAPSWPASGRARCASPRRCADRKVFGSRRAGAFEDLTREERGHVRGDDDGNGVWRHELHGTPWPVWRSRYCSRVRPQPPAQRVTVEWLKSLKTTSNDPAGDGFIGSRDQLSRSIDAIVADSSLVSPTYLFIASKTALTLNRVEDAGFLFYAAQLRTAFDFERYDAPRQPDGNNAATYLGFLRQTIGESVNPAIMREPARFTAAMNRLDRWELVPSRQAFYPEFASNRFKTAPETWAASAATLKATGSWTRFGRRQARLLNDPEYFAAFRVVQAAEPRRAAADGREPRAIPEEYRRDGSRGAAVVSRRPRLRPRLRPRPRLRLRARRVRTRRPRCESALASRNPRSCSRVEPEFPSGARGSVIMEVTIGDSRAW